MDHQSAGIKFAAIGHQDNWDKVHRFVNTLRITGGSKELQLEDIRKIYGYIPPRKLFDIAFDSPVSGACQGMYIETFIPPDELDARHLSKNIQRVKDACQCAVREGASVVSLGGFTSIVLEQARQQAYSIGHTFFTTGNTLTAAFIVKGIEQVCREKNIAIEHARILIIGSTGDIGSACTGYFSGKAGSLMLCARREPQLAQQQQALIEKGVQAVYSTNVNDLLPRADIIICAASSLLENAQLSLLKEHSIVCDAGYPKNLLAAAPAREKLCIFAGGMGRVTRGYTFFPDHKKDIYDSQDENLIHGCLAEGIVLAMENSPCSYSTGRGLITMESMEKIYSLALKHGFIPYTGNHTTGRQYEKRNCGTDTALQTDLHP